MPNKKFFQLFLVTVLVIASFVNVGQAFAWGSCGGSYYVQWGDTLGTIASRCGTTVADLRAANPNMGYVLYAGQTLTMPGSSNGNGYDGNGYNGYYGNGNNGNGYNGNGYNGNGYNGAGYDGNGYNGNGYNGNGYNGNGNNGYYGDGSHGNGYSSASCTSYGNGYAGSGQYGGGGTYMVRWGDTMRIIADRMNVNVNALIAANPQLWNPNLIFAGQVLHLPGGGSSTYCVQRGDTLKIIAARFGTTVYNLQALNPQLWNPNLIYAGQVIRLW